MSLGAIVVSTFCFILSTFPDLQDPEEVEEVEEEEEEDAQVRLHILERIA